MSMHKSLKTRSQMAGQRSVLSRWERIEKLKEAGRWKDGDGVLGLPKVRTKFKVRVRKAADAPAAGAAAPAAGAAAKGAAAAPAAGAKAAAGGKPAAPAAKGAPAAAPAAKDAKKK